MHRAPDDERHLGGGPVTTRIILDVDTGTDDAVALMVAALSPDIESVGATTVNGNTALANGTENPLRVFDRLPGPADEPKFVAMLMEIVGRTIGD